MASREFVRITTCYCCGSDFAKVFQMTKRHVFSVEDLSRKTEISCFLFLYVSCCYSCLCLDLLHHLVVHLSVIYQQVFVAPAEQGRCHWGSPFLPVSIVTENLLAGALERVRVAFWLRRSTFASKKSALCFNLSYSSCDPPCLSFSRWVWVRWFERWSAWQTFLMCLN